MDVTAAIRRHLAGGTAGTALLITLLSGATIGTIWAFENAGYTPCELCLIERNPFYASVPLGLATALAAWTDWWRITRILFAVLALLFLASIVLASYHAGVEWKLWPGPTGCSGAVQAAATVNDFLKQLDTVKVVRCDAAALRVLGLSFAGWNVVVSLLLFILSCVGIRSAGRAVKPRR